MGGNLVKRIIKTITSLLLAALMITGTAAGASAAVSQRIIIRRECGSDGCQNGRGYDCLKDILARGCPGGSCRDLSDLLNSSEDRSNSDCRRGSDCAEESTEDVPAAEPTTSAQSQPAAPVQQPTERAAVTPTEALKPDESTAAQPQNSYQLNSNEKEVVDLINDIRRQNGLSELTVDPELSRVARVKSQDMRDKGYFSHTSPTYGSPFDMMTSFGIKYRAAGENIAMGYRTAQSVVDGWMNSPGHRSNILNARFTRIGMGYIADGNYWTQMFIG